MSIKRTGGRKPTMGNWRCEYMAQSEYAVCKCCHINGGSAYGCTPDIQALSLPGDTRAFGDMCTRFNSRPRPRHSLCVFLRDFRETITCDATHRRRRTDLRIYFSFTPLERALPRCLHAVSESIENLNGGARIKRKREIFCSSILSSI